MMSSDSSASTAVGNTGTARQHSLLHEDDTQNDITSSNCNPEKFHEVFGVYPSNLEKEINEYVSKREAGNGDAQPPNWVQPADSRQIICTTTTLNPEINQQVVRAKLPWTNRTFRFVVDIASVMGHICYAFCPPIPSMITKKVAFHPPKLPFYYFKITRNDGTWFQGNAEDAYGYENVSIELRPFANEQGETFDGAKAFSVKTSRKTYLACVRIESSLQHRTPSLKKKVIIFCQPNSSDLGMFVWNRNTADLTLDRIANRVGVDIISFDYSGFGMSTGRSTEQNMYDDLNSVYNHLLKETPDVKIFLVGLSLGTAACVHHASLNPKNLGGVVLLAPLTSGVRILMSTPKRKAPYPVDSFKSIDKISKVQAPVFIAHGLLDHIIAYDHGVSLLRRCQQPMPIQLVKHAEHTDVFTASVSKKVFNFVAREAENYDLYYERSQVIQEMDDILKKLESGEHSLTSEQSNSSVRPASVSSEESEALSLLEEEMEKKEIEESISSGDSTKSTREYNHADHVKSHARLPKTLFVSAIKGGH
ncbi:unnamed protein product [Bursaphelenchus okinawaensis]|uniref:Serine aminopeptidase S33 domain-containing protein n=1 Tax=Bursaphelenchus okinawaensis TaxID=465554 RepID=A0A811LDG6_9BILA|nr:unnamed protein product [Bursaphelenchus okinawaensis]CAG9120649.1 unnamed protein product [Bursaphelenchus okinawaensis]